MSQNLQDLWEALKPGIIPIEVSEKTEYILHRVFFAGAAAALTLQGAAESEAHKVLHMSLAILENEVAAQLQLPEEEGE
jgi:hypothetical protein